MGKLTFQDLSILDIEPQDSISVSVPPLNGGETMLHVHLSPNYVLFNQEALVISPDMYGMTVYRNPSSGSLILVSGKRNEQRLVLEFGESGDEKSIIVLEQIAVCEL